MNNLGLYYKNKKNKHRLQHDKDSGVFVCATLTDMLVCFHCLRKQQQQGSRPAPGSFHAH